MSRSEGTVVHDDVRRTATGTARLNDKQTDLDANPPAVNSLSGSGAPLPGSEGAEKSRVTLNVNLVTCRYNVTFTPTINATATSSDGSTTDMPAEVGTVRSGEYATAAYRQALSGGGAMPAHSLIWGSQNDGEAFFPLGLGQDIFLFSLEQDGGAGTADVSWSITPAK